MYRIKLNSGSSATRLREKDFYEQKAIVETEGFIEAMKIALHNGNIHYKDIPILNVKFHIRLAISMMRSEHSQLAKKEITIAQNISQRMTTTVLNSLKVEFKTCLSPIVNFKSNSLEVL
jgi:hypothetical protein